MAAQPVVACLEASSDPPIERPFPSSRRFREIAARRARISRVQMSADDQDDEHFANAQAITIPKLVPAHPCGIVYDAFGIPKQDVSPLVRSKLVSMFRDTMNISKLPKDANNAGKSTYMVLVQPVLIASARAAILRQLGRLRNQDPLDFEQIATLQERLEPLPSQNGSCSHHGSGIFSTALHALIVHLDKNHDLDTIKLQVRIAWGAGALLGPSPFMRYREFEVEILALPDIAIQVHRQAHLGSPYISGVSGDVEKVFTRDQDIAFLKLKDDTAATGFKFHRKVLPYLGDNLLRPLSTEALPTPAQLFAVNGMVDPEEYYKLYVKGALIIRRPTVTEVKKSLEKMHCLKISVSHGIATRSPRINSPVGLSADYNHLMRHTCACLNGSSGGGVLDEAYRHVGIHVATEIGESKVNGSLNMNPNHWGQAVIWSAPAGQSMIERHVLPALRSSRMRDEESIAAFERVLLP